MDEKLTNAIKALYAVSNYEAGIGQKECFYDKPDFGELDPCFRLMMHSHVGISYDQVLNKISIKHAFIHEREYWRQMVDAIEKALKFRELSRGDRVEILRANLDKVNAVLAPLGVYVSNINETRFTRFFGREKVKEHAEQILKSGIVEGFYGDYADLYAAAFTEITNSPYRYVKGNVIAKFDTKAIIKRAEDVLMVEPEYNVVCSYEDKIKIRVAVSQLKSNLSVHSTETGVCLKFKTKSLREVIKSLLPEIEENGSVTLKGYDMASVRPIVSALSMGLSCIRKGNGVMICKKQDTITDRIFALLPSLEETPEILIDFIDVSNFDSFRTLVSRLSVQTDVGYSAKIKDGKVWLAKGNNRNKTLYLESAITEIAFGKTRAKIENAIPDDLIKYNNMLLKRGIFNKMKVTYENGELFVVKC